MTNRVLPSVSRPWRNITILFIRVRTGHEKPGKSWNLTAGP